jgi:hypothetical protein
MARVHNAKGELQLPGVIAHDQGVDPLQLGAGQAWRPSGDRLGPQGIQPALAVFGQPAIDRGPGHSQPRGDLVGMGALLDLADGADPQLLQGLVIELAAVVVTHAGTRPECHRKVKLLMNGLVGWPRGRIVVLMGNHRGRSVSQVDIADGSSDMQRRQPMRPDPEYRTSGGWKVHLTIGPNSYEQRASAVKRWLARNIEGTEHVDWKHLEGGDLHEKDFTVYLGSYVTMIAFVNALEKDPIVEQLDDFNGPSSDRIVGDSGKVGARFDPRGERAGWDWVYGWNGIPFRLQDKRLVLAGKSGQDAAERPRAVLKDMFGDYFLPVGID